MRKTLPVLMAASLLMLATPLRAADLPKPEAQKAEALTDAAAAVQPKAEDGISIIVIEHSPQVSPNPYGNPAPRLISDAWAARV
ncbi:MAG: hypothetical protein U1E93_06855 [Alphaproteobacteria bacterium]